MIGLRTRVCVRDKRSTHTWPLSLPLKPSQRPMGLLELSSLYISTYIKNESESGEYDDDMVWTEDPRVMIIVKFNNMTYCRLRRL